jgi:hypothetical protein
MQGAVVFSAPATTAAETVLVSSAGNVSCDIEFARSLD